MNVLFPGSFDPFTKGHADIVERTLKFADNIIIGIGIHQEKKGMLSPKERENAIRQLYKDNPKVSVEIYEGLTTEFAKKKGISLIVRGVRNTVDFEYEKNIAEVNRQLTGIETILIFADRKLSAISSSIVRELNSYGVDTKEFMP